jgi:hypothetical protein
MAQALLVEQARMMVVLEVRPRHEGSERVLGTHSVAVWWSGPGRRGQE